MENKYSVSVNELPFLPTAHPAGQKKTFFSGEEAVSELTQFAYGRLQGGETIPAHHHPTMEEFFYFLSGKGNYVIGDNTISLKQGVAVRIPAGVTHILTAVEELDFVYFGIAI